MKYIKLFEAYGINLLLNKLTEMLFEIVSKQDKKEYKFIFTTPNHLIKEEGAEEHKWEKVKKDIDVKLISISGDLNLELGKEYLDILKIDSILIIKFVKQSELEGRNIAQYKGYVNKQGQFISEIGLTKSKINLFSHEMRHFYQYQNQGFKDYDSPNLDNLKTDFKDMIEYLYYLIGQSEIEAHITGIYNEANDLKITKKNYESWLKNHEYWITIEEYEDFINKLENHELDYSQLKDIKNLFNLSNKDKKEDLIRKFKNLLKFKFFDYKYVDLFIKAEVPKIKNHLKLIKRKLLRLVSGLEN